LLNSNTSFTCPDNMVNFGLLTAEICWRVWSTPANFNGFRVGSVTARHSSSGRQPNFAALNRGRHLYSAGRPSRWALTHISIVRHKIHIAYDVGIAANSGRPIFTESTHLCCRIRAYQMSKSDDARAKTLQTVGGLDSPLTINAR